MTGYRGCSVCGQSIFISARGLVWRHSPTLEIRKTLPYNGVYRPQICRGSMKPPAVTP